jgi:hypothetical protein
MSRYSDYGGDDPISLCWEGNILRILHAKASQPKLRDFVSSLLAIPNRRLIAGSICKGGEVCAVGAFAAYRGKLDKSRDWEGDEWETRELGTYAGLGSMLSYELGYMNDEEFYRLTPEERWERFYRWARDLVKWNLPVPA